MTSFLKRISKNKNILIHLILLTVAALILMQTFYYISFSERYNQALASVYEEENIALSMADSACATNMACQSIEDEQEDNEMFSSLFAFLNLINRWERYHVKVDGEYLFDIPEKMDIPFDQLLEDSRVYLSAEILTLKEDDHIQTASNKTGENQISISEKIQDQLEDRLKDTDQTVIHLDGVSYYGIKEASNQLVFMAIAETERDLSGGLDNNTIARLADLRFGVEDSGSLLMIDTANHEILTAPDNSVTEFSAEDIGIPEDFITETGYETSTGSLTLNGRSYLISKRLISEDLLACALFEKNALDKSVSRSVMINVLVFSAVITSVFLFASVQLTASWGRRKVRTKKIGRFFYLDISLGFHMLPVLLAGIVLIEGISFYGQSLVALSLKTIQNTSRIEQIRSGAEQDSKQQDHIIEQTQSLFLKKLDLLNDLLDLNPGYFESDELIQLASSLKLDSVDIYSGSDYNLLATTSRQGSAGKESDNTDFDEIMRGTAKNRITVLDNGLVPPADGSEGSYRCEVAVRRTDGSGIVVAVISDVHASLELASLNADRIESSYYGEDGDVYFSLDKETLTVTDSTVSDWIGLSKEELGLTDSSLESHYTGFQELDRVRYFLSEVKSDSVYEFLGAPTNDLLKDAVLGIKGVLPISLLELFLFLLLSILCPGTLRKQKSAPAENDEGYPYVWLPEQLSFLQRTKKKWHHMMPEDRFRTLFNGLMLIIAFFVISRVTYMLLFEAESGQNSIAIYIIKGDWDKGFNIFALTDIILILFASMMVSWLLRKLLRFAAAFFGRRTETLADMLDSFIRYLISIIVLFWALYLLGFKPSTLATGAGVMSVVIGIGAQSVVGDILSGIFIVADNVFGKGDIIEVDGWRGRVMEISARTTKVRDFHGNVRIFNNSTIKSVINKSTEYTRIPIKIAISYEADLRHVESVLKSSLKEIRKKIPELENDPVYYGVLELADSGIILCIMATCREDHLDWVQACILRELKLLFDDNGIEIPYPQMVVHHAD